MLLIHTKFISQFCFVYCTGLSHIDPALRLSVAAAEWKRIKGTEAAEKYASQAKTCRKLAEVSADGDDTAKKEVSKWSVVLMLPFCNSATGRS